MEFSMSGNKAVGRTIKTVICTLDNLPILKEQVSILKGDPLIDEIIVVINGSIDGTKEWCEGRDGLTVIYHEENNGASVGRNSGIEAAGTCDYFLFLDGGIMPLRGGTEKMLDYLNRTPKADVIGVEIPNFETDYNKAWRRWPEPILDTYRNTRLSHTAYCLARYQAFDGIRFCEEGPFSEPGWACEDDEMAYQWNEAGIVTHVCTDVHPYRRASGSFQRLFKETGVWPSQFGSVYEKRLVWLQQNWPQHEPGVQWGEPWLTVVVRVGMVEETARLIKRAHDELRLRHFEAPWERYFNPYSIVAWGGGPDWLTWAEPRHLRQHHGDTIVLNEYGPSREIFKRGPGSETTWTGDFHLWNGDDWREAVRPGAHYYGLVSNEASLTELLETYDKVHPPQPVKNPPSERREL